VQTNPVNEIRSAEKEKGKKHAKGRESRNGEEKTRIEKRGIFLQRKRVTLQVAKKENPFTEKNECTERGAEERLQGLR